MQNEYQPSSVEPKWQKRWEDANAYRVDLKKAKDPYYSLVMFPYPSGDKLHVGHWYNFAPADSYARYQRMHGKQVFSPMGFDAFGLPAENYAIKTGVPPAQSIRTNVETMIAQLRRIGTMYDWEKMVNTSEPWYYRWTQWLFLEMFKHGFAYKRLSPVNWCPKDQTVLANEQVWEGKCERCGTEVIQKNLTQWFWSTRKYAQQLLDGLDTLDWPEKTKTMQRNWIGRNEGVNIVSKVKDLDIEFEVFDSVPQTFMAQTFTVIAPEHPMVRELVKGTSFEKQVTEFADRIARKKASKEFDFEKDLEGIFTGRYVDNPFGTGDLPIWVASFVVMEYGTGIVHCSAHDTRDFAFAKKYDIPLHPVMFPADTGEANKVRALEHCCAKDAEGILEQPEQFKGRKWGEVRDDIIEYLEKKKIARRAVHYRLRDWLVSRQRYWGAPIPIVYDPEGKPHPVPEEHLPWLLPTDVAFKPTGKSPLTESKEFLDRTERIFGKGWTPEFDTMDTFVCSSFYYLMYLNAPEHHSRLMASASHGDLKTAKKKPGKKDVAEPIVDPTLEKNWMPVDMYIGGPEHACMHLIYARFVMMALKDFGFVSHSEPFQKLVHQGLITNNGAKMSKSKGNVVSPDSFVDRHGSDVFRMYLMFMGPFTDGGDWSDTGIKGIDRFVQRSWRRLSGIPASMKDDLAIPALVHRTVKRVTESMEKMHFNTAISALMECLNALESIQDVSRGTAKVFARLLAPLAPHLAEELWEALHEGEPRAKRGETGFVVDQEWPGYDPALLVSDTLTIAIQVNGKLRATMDVAADTPEKDILRMAKEQVNVKKFLDGQKPKKEIYVKGKLVSLVV